MDDKEYRHLIRDIKEKRMKIRVKEILTYIPECELEEARTKFRIDLYCELCRVHGKYVSVDWALKSIFNIEKGVF